MDERVPVAEKSLVALEKSGKNPPVPGCASPTHFRTTLGIDAGFLRERYLMAAQDPPPTKPLTPACTYDRYDPEKSSNLPRRRFAAGRCWKGLSTADDGEIGCFGQNLPAGMALTPQAPSPWDSADG